MKSILWLIGKDGELSKTAVMLWLGYIAVMFKYVFAEQTVPTPWGDYPVGPFNEMEAVTILSLVSGLYLGSNRIWQKGQVSNVGGSVDDQQRRAETTPVAAAPNPNVTQDSQGIPVDPKLFLELLKMLPTQKAPEPQQPKETPKETVHAPTSDTVIKAGSPESP